MASKSERINLRFLPEERRELGRIARIAKETPTTWARQAVLGVLISSGGRLIATADCLQEYADAKGRINGNG